MARASNATIEIEAARVPIIPGALELATQGLLTSGDKSNRAYVGDDIEVGVEVSKPLSSLFFDPQTAGGLLISIDESRADALLTRLIETYPDASRIGRIAVERGAHALVVK
jgi:selenide,water dikinase